MAILDIACGAIAAATLLGGGAPAPSTQEVAGASSEARVQLAPTLQEMQARAVGAAVNAVAPADVSVSTRAFPVLINSPIGQTVPAQRGHQLDPQTGTLRIEENA